ncbi:MAG: hypothetical protein PVJ09_00775 [Candidatus Woesebacteria bacterium]|jgi:hypothetical protein
MRKEVVISILIGIILGLIITYGVYLTRKSGPIDTPTIDVDQLSPTPDSSNPNQLMLSSPEDEIVQEEQTTTVSGTTLANNFVVIFVGNQETIVTSDESGNFSTELELEAGSNVITVYAIDEDGKKSSIERTIIVTSQLLLEESEVEASKSAEKEE